MAVLVLASAAALVGVSLWVETKLQRATVLTAYPGRPAGGSGTNWLLVGSDSRAELTPEQQASLSTGGDLGASRSDTLLLVHVPGLESSEPATVVSIPRDSYVNIPGWGRDKINVAFTLGGAPLLARTVEEATGLRLDHYAEIGFAGFARIVDAVGGVQICLVEAITDPLAGIDLPAGCQQLRGPAALGYARTRASGRADVDRMPHQREVMSALVRRAAEPAVWLNPWRWYALPRAVVAALTVDRGAHVWDLGLLGWALRGPAVTLTVPIGAFALNDSGNVVLWDEQAAGELFGALRTDSAVPQLVFDTQP